MSATDYRSFTALTCEEGCIFCFNVRFREISPTELGIRAIDVDKQTTELQRTAIRGHFCQMFTTRLSLHEHVRYSSVSKLWHDFFLPCPVREERRGKKIRPKNRSVVIVTDRRLCGHPPLTSSCTGSSFSGNRNAQSRAVGRWLPQVIEVSFGHSLEQYCS